MHGEKPTRTRKLVFQTAIPVRSRRREEKLLQRRMICENDQNRKRGNVRWEEKFTKNIEKHEKELDIKHKKNVAVPFDLRDSVLY